MSENYTVGWICALEVELTAALEMLDDEHDLIPLDASDKNSYTLGRIGKHNVVLACLSAGAIGTIPAATAAFQMARSFKNLRFGLLVGIGGGVPDLPNHDIRLGDVVVSQPEKTSPGVIQYDLGKHEDGGQFNRRGVLSKPPEGLLTALSKLKANHRRRKTEFQTHLAKITKLDGFAHPSCPDLLFEATYSLKSALDCDLREEEGYLRREERKNDDLHIHYGTIASGNAVIRDAVVRDRLSKALDGVLCFEMEAAGLMDSFPCLVVRGIADYADSHKNDVWHGYASATAAAFAKELLVYVHPSIVDNMSPAVHSMKDMEQTAHREAKLESGLQTSLALPCIATRRNSIDNATADAHNSITMASMTVLSHLLPREAVQLGRLISNAKFPGQDFYPKVDCQYSDRDIVTSRGKDFHDLRQNVKESKLQSLLSSLISVGYQGKDTLEARIEKTMTTTYTLQDTDNKFEQMCSDNGTKKWFERAIKKGRDVYFITGMQTITDALLTITERGTGQAKTPIKSPMSLATTEGSTPAIKTSVDGIVPNAKPKQRETGFAAEGEQIYAVQYRKVKFDWFSSRDITNAFLEKDNRWKILWETRGNGHDGKDDVLQVTLHAGDSPLDLGKGFEVVKIGDAKIFFPE